MRDELSVPPRDHFLTGDSRPPGWTVERGRALCDPVVGPLLSLDEVPVPGPARCARTSIQRTDAFGDGGRPTRESAGSTALTIERATAGAVGEAVERYSQSLFRYDDMRVARHDELDAPACPPEALARRRAGEADAGESVRDAAYHWVAARSLVTGDRVLVPGQSVYVPFGAETSLREFDSTGTAAGSSPLAACYGAVRELVERECFAVGYVSKLAYPAVDLSGATGEIARLHDALAARVPEVHVLDATLDHPFATYLVLVVDPDNAPVVTVGLGCHANGRVALRDALLEAIQSTEQGVFAADPGVLRGSAGYLRERVSRWCDPASLSGVDHWRGRDAVVDPPRAEPVAPSAAMARFVEYLRDREFDCLVTDVTAPDLADTGLCVVRAVAPAFYPMSLRGLGPYVDDDRLFDLPVEAGYRTTPVAPADRNDVPHPFL